MKILYYDCFAGISGDMHLGAMIDAGVDPEHLLSELKKLPVSGFRLEIQRDKKQSIEGTRVDVVLDHGTDEHQHGHGHWHSHGNSPGHSEPQAHQQPHRNLGDIEQIIDQSALPEGTKSRAHRMFRLIAEAEAKIHGVPVSKIHFHEVGALDSIVDIIGAAICLEYLKPDRILCSTVELGSGTIRCAHGTMPVPAPATAEILKDIPVRLGGTGHEATTPTGAAILAANVDEYTDRPVFRPDRTAYGIGQRDAELPNVLRVFVGQDAVTEMSAGVSVGVSAGAGAGAGPGPGPGPGADAGAGAGADAGAGAGAAPVQDPASSAAAIPGNTIRDEKIMIACQIDDMNPEQYPHIMDRLLSMGASDVSLTPTIMKKGRPGVILDVLCDAGLLDKLSNTILRETTTLGVRYHPVSRIMLERESEIFQSSIGPVTMKKARLDGKLLKWKAEYEDCKALAEKHNMALREVTRLVNTEFAKKQLSE